MQGRLSREGVAKVTMLALLVVLLLIGTFFDKAIAETLYSPRNVVATLITTTGIYPFFASVPFFMGVAFERVRSLSMVTVGKVVSSVVIIATALFVGFIGAAAIVDGDCLGSLFPSLNRNMPVIAVLALTVEYPLFLAGYRLAGRTDDGLLLRRVICLAIVLITAYVTMQLVKNVFNRPRFRTVALGYEGVGFVPWYTPAGDPSELMATYDLAKNEFSSFPSGHAIMSVSTIYLLYALSWLMPKLRDKRFMLTVAGFTFAVVIMFTRMVLGAHYLSDVSMGAIIGLGFVVVFDLLQRRVEASGDARG